MNKVVLIGRLTKDPELKFSAGSGLAVTTFTLAVNRRQSKDGSREADFIPVIAFGKTAETIANYLAKGQQVAISGRIQTGSYDAKDGTKRYTTDVIVDEFDFLEKKGASTGGDRSFNSDSNSDFGMFNSDDSGFSPVDGEIPF